LDTIDSDGKIAWNAALSFIVNGETDDHLEMLEIGVIKRLLEDKWATYAKVIIKALNITFINTLPGDPVFNTSLQSP
jgi:transient receptor potential cation channel subfamily V member 6